MLASTWPPARRARLCGKHASGDRRQASSAIPLQHPRCARGSMSLWCSGAADARTLHGPQGSKRVCGGVGSQPMLVGTTILLDPSPLIRRGKNRIAVSRRSDGRVLRLAAEWSGSEGAENCKAAAAAPATTKGRSSKSSNSKKGDNYHRHHLEFLPARSNLGSSGLGGHGRGARNRRSSGWHARAQVR